MSIAELSHAEQVRLGVLIDYSEVGEMVGFKCPFYVSQELEDDILLSLPHFGVDANAVEVAVMGCVGFMAGEAMKALIIAGNIPELAARNHLTFDTVVPWKDGLALGAALQILPDDDGDTTFNLMKLEQLP